ncbi:MAG: cyclase family protein [Simkaniaceae bacterium]|nr:cyclase family protein [Simkaniaceae bacterium]
MLDLENCDIIDLSHELHEEIPTWTGSCGFSYDVKMVYDDGVRVLKYTMHAGIGTHLDAPSHFIQGGKHVGAIPLEQCVAALVVLDFTEKCHENLMISREDLLDKEIPKGCFVAIYTGWEKYWDDRDRYANYDHDGIKRFPGLLGEAAELLVERGVVGLGIDTLSPDGSNQDDFPVHRAILGSGSYIIENMKNLGKVPSHGAYIIALPPKVKEGSEIILRPIALCPTKK